MDHELRIGDRVLHYSGYGDPIGPPVVSLGGSPSTRWNIGITPALDMPAQLRSGIHQFGIGVLEPALGLRIVKGSPA